MNPLLLFGAVALIIMIAYWALCGRWIPDKKVLRVNRKWGAIWIGGVFVFLFLPGLFAHLGTLRGPSLVFFPVAYVLLFGPTVGFYMNEVRKVKKEAEATNSKDSQTSTSS